ncbi:hypothetical protein VOLCADRAFT_99767 [Volvox carteri f. nagariensis]|uniref:F5/8 type C domain-containing protein n=1 Tax=Volvox carteri f. nagariensis TaxID=3068 RepID=D8UIL3_VOLCA|nr:uncharacterized protein VOLCADRAFT_99767 [Volvox carteri f. nagariensis]EFJ40433.1 hypothetical protein VOLCADRAFT_99767 [Volvox carteri f. nagariensis]|eukprot:XP_002958513.1 hypothetical protein VOLCADRAFT_99767 [Volvox carteri f. nagariensis]
MSLQIITTGTDIGYNTFGDRAVKNAFPDIRLYDNLSTYAGKDAGKLNQEGYCNTVLGYEAAGQALAGSGNVAAGYRAAYLTQGNENVFVGNLSGTVAVMTAPTWRVLIGFCNTVSSGGALSLLNVNIGSLGQTSGRLNTALGYSNSARGRNNVLLGANVACSRSNNVLLGAGTPCSGSGNIIMGGSNSDVSAISCLVLRSPCLPAMSNTTDGYINIMDFLTRTRGNVSLTGDTLKLSTTRGCVIAMNDQDVTISPRSMLLVDGPARFNAPVTLQQSFDLFGDLDVGGAIHLNRGARRFWTIDIMQRPEYRGVAADLVFRSRNNTECSFTDDFIPDMLNFTGRHRARVADSCPALKPGMLVVATGCYGNLEGEADPSIDEAIPVVDVAREPGDPRVFGVVAAVEPSDAAHHSYRLGNLAFTMDCRSPRVVVNSVGEGGILTCWFPLRCRTSNVDVGASIMTVHAGDSTLAMSPSNITAASKSNMTLSAADQIFINSRGLSITTDTMQLKQQDLSLTASGYLLVAGGSQVLLQSGSNMVKVTPTSALLQTVQGDMTVSACNSLAVAAASNVTIASSNYALTAGAVTVQSATAVSTSAALISSISSSQVLLQSGPNSFSVTPSNATVYSRNIASVVGDSQVSLRLGSNYVIVTPSNVASYATSVLSSVGDSQVLLRSASNFVSLTPSAISLSSTSNLSMTSSSNVTMTTTNVDVTGSALVKIGNSNVAVQVPYPPAPLTGTTTTLSGQSYGNGTYIISATSSVMNLERAFDRNLNTSTYGSSLYYNVDSRASGLVSMKIDGNDYRGEWYGLQLPSAVIASSYSFAWAGVFKVDSWILAASTDGATWVVLDNKDQINNTLLPGVSTLATLSLPGTTSYKYYRLLVTKLVSGATLGIAEFSINVSQASPSSTLTLAPATTSLTAGMDMLITASNNMTVTSLQAMSVSACNSLAMSTACNMSLTVGRDVTATACNVSITAAGTRSISATGTLQAVSAQSVTARSGSNALFVSPLVTEVRAVVGDYRVGTSNSVLVDMANTFRLRAATLDMGLSNDAIVTARGNVTITSGDVLTATSSNAAIVRSGSNLLTIAKDSSLFQTCTGDMMLVCGPSGGPGAASVILDSSATYGVNIKSAASNGTDSVYLQLASSNLTAVATGAHMFYVGDTSNGMPNLWVTDAENRYRSSEHHFFIGDTADPAAVRMYKDATGSNVLMVRGRIDMQGGVNSVTTTNLDIMDKQITLAKVPEGDATPADGVANTLSGILVSGIPLNASFSNAPNPADIEDMTPRFYEKSMLWHNGTQGMDKLGSQAGVSWLQGMVNESYWQVRGGHLQLAMTQQVGNAVRDIAFGFRINERGELELFKCSWDPTAANGGPHPPHRALG